MYLSGLCCLCKGEAIIGAGRPSPPILNVWLIIVGGVTAHSTLSHGKVCTPLPVKMHACTLGVLWGSEQYMIDAVLGGERASVSRGHPFKTVWLPLSYKKCQFRIEVCRTLASAATCKYIHCGYPYSLYGNPQWISRQGGDG